MMKTNHRWVIGAIALLISQLACRPVIAVGWQEIVVVAVLVVVLVGPLLFRLYRVLSRFQEPEDRSKKK